jgi:putative transposase
MAAQQRLDLSGPAMVFVTTTVQHWTPVFADKRLARLMTGQLHETLEKYEISMCAYVVMPSHFHALLGFPEIDRLSKVMRAIKSMSARRIQPFLSAEQRTVFSRNGQYLFWKRRFDDLIIWSERQFIIKAEYIHNNPVKAGLVEQSTNYVFSSATDWLLGEPGIIPVDKTWKWQDHS